MKHLTSGFMVGLAGLVIASCSAGSGDEPPLDRGAEAPHEQLGEARQALMDYRDPPRCGPRNCVAMCVTCEYDICRIFGGTREECRAEMEQCKDDCSEPRECRPGDPCDQ